jgi:hypothetical protein
MDPMDLYLAVRENFIDHEVISKVQLLSMLGIMEQIQQFQEVSTPFNNSQSVNQATHVMVACLP